MIAKIEINFTLFRNLTSAHTFTIDNCTYIENFNKPITSPFNCYFDVYNENNEWVHEVEISDDDNHYYDEYDDDIFTILQTGNKLIVTGDFSPLSKLDYLLRHNIIKLIEVSDTLIGCYTLNCENLKVDKSSNIDFVKYISGTFNHSIGLKNINIDIENFNDEQFNYVYIEKLNRYYYVDSVEIISSKITRLHLKEDVLYSFMNLIQSQKAFISRYENADNTNIVDTRLPLEDVKTIEMIDFSNGDLVNCEFDFNMENDKPIIAVTTLSTNVQGGHGKTDAPSYSSELPDIRSTMNNNEYIRFISFDNLFYLVTAYRSDDATSSFIESVIYLPFNTTLAFDLQTSNSTAIFVKDKYINNHGDYVATNSSDTPLKSYYIPFAKDGVSPYLIVADIEIEEENLSFEQYEPYSNYEIFIPFVSWVKIDYAQFINQRIIVYYAIDFKTGIGTAYIYNMTNEYIIWSGTCQVGIKLDMTTTNQLENTKQKQSNALNMTLGLMSSTLAIGIGVATANPVAIAGGVLGGGKTIANGVNANRMLFERAQSSFGTPECALYSPEKVMIRKTYNKPVELDDEQTYKEINGKPYNNYIDGLDNLSGYVEIPEIHFNPQNENIYQDEINEIVSLLKEGVIL